MGSLGEGELVAVNPLVLMEKLAPRLKQKHFGAMGRSCSRLGGSIVDVGDTYSVPTTSKEHRMSDNLHPTMPATVSPHLKLYFLLYMHQMFNKQKYLS
ncbi:hypothetical protein J6590_019462 [Homalodisca vitripennis]|nr:hypothetical protein J6590_019462 [Homalodisca vitripennis]